MLNVELLQALKDIRDELDPDNCDNQRADDPEGALDAAYERARRVIAKAERDAASGTAQESQETEVQDNG